MTALSHGEVEPLGTLYVRYGQRLHALLARLHRDLEAEALEDLVHETFLQLHRGADRYRHRGNLYAWICGIGVRRARNLRREQALRRRLLGIHGQAAQPLGSRDQSPDTRLEIEKALAVLSEDQRVVLLMHVLEGLSAKEIALSLGIREKTVWTRIHRARRAMLQARKGQP